MNIKLTYSRSFQEVKENSSSLTSIHITVFVCALYLMRRRFINEMLLIYYYYETVKYGLTMIKKNISYTMVL